MTVTAYKMNINQFLYFSIKSGEYNQIFSPLGFPLATIGEHVDISKYENNGTIQLDINDNEQLKNKIIIIIIIQ